MASAAAGSVLSTAQPNLPSRSVDKDTIADTFADFILYCNPFYGPDVDTSELKRIFQSPPKSDGNSFDIYHLWELVRKLSEGEIKSWIQLALELGVEPPSAKNGASVQKVQQYTVRLKVSVPGQNL